MIDKDVKDKDKVKKRLNIKYVKDFLTAQKF